MSIKLETTNADEWRGSFGIAANHLIEDILSDGYPFAAKITTELESGGTGTMLVAIEGISSGRAKFRQGGRVGYFNTIDLLSIEVL